MALYNDGKPVSGLNSIPRLTLAQYNALNVKPKFWVRTDAPESYKKLSADQVSYDSNNTVKDKIDDISTDIYENYNMFKLVGFSGGNTDKTITFSGNGSRRCANMILFLGSQSAVSNPIIIGFQGGSGYGAISNVVVAPNDYGVTANGLTLTVPRLTGDWGVHTIIKLYPNDEITYTIS